jgi:hypothetical protein
MRWYQCWERLNHPKKRASRIYRQYPLEGIHPRDIQRVNQDGWRATHRTTSRSLHTSLQAPRAGTSRCWSGFSVTVHAAWPEWTFGTSIGPISGENSGTTFLPRRRAIPGRRASAPFMNWLARTQPRAAERPGQLRAAPPPQRRVRRVQRTPRLLGWWRAHKPARKEVRAGPFKRAPDSSGPAAIGDIA